MAKDGGVIVYSARYCIEIESDFHDYFLAREVVEKSGLLHSGDRLSSDRVKALDFAKAFYEELLKRC